MMNNNFRPLDLNPVTINGMFKKSLCTSDTKNAFSVFFKRKEMGFPNNSDPVVFDMDRLNANRDTIAFLFGQLYTSHHQEDLLFTLNDLFKKYNGENWTTNPVDIMKLVHLGLVSEYFVQFDAKGPSSSMMGNLIPTLSPKDPNYQQWYEGYQKTLTKKKGGQEPADN